MLIGDTANEFVERYRQRTNGVISYTFSDAVTHLTNAASNAPVIGADMNGNPVTVDLHSDSPHVAISMGTGGGKSNTLKTLAAQFARNEATTVVLDFKRHSHRWARSVPGITYCRDIEEIHDTLIAIAYEGRQRNHRADQLTDDEFARSEHVPHRIVLLVEELNATMAELQDYWTEVRPTGQRGYKYPKRSPAVKAFHEILLMGRAVDINVLAVAQRLSTESLGGGGGYGRGADARENFSMRILARYTWNTWRMLVPECEYEPSSEILGRAQVCVAGVATPTQILYMTDQDAINWAVGKD